MNGTVTVHQLLAGRDFAVARDAAAGSSRRAAFRTAAQMRNYVYCVVHVRSGAACVVDACWDVGGILAALRDRGVQAEDITAAVYTHHHFDHTGGRVPAFMTGGKRGVVVDGMAEVLAALPCVEAVGIGALDADKAARQCGVPLEAIRRHSDGDVVWRAGESNLRCWSTPGHTAGSISLVCTDTEATPPTTAIITGDTLFIGSSGRFDLPDSNAKDMLRSLARLSTLPRDTVVYPGHNYAIPSHSTIGEETSTNAMMVQATRFAARDSNPESHVEKHNVSGLPEYVPLPAYLSVAKSVYDAWENGTSQTHAPQCCCGQHAGAAGGSVYSNSSTDTTASKL
jgi:glyoxylase-like metal-dependent hydrolase (beta-lactamase superfamily II)